MGLLQREREVQAAIARRVRALRTKASLSQQGLADQAGLCLSTVSRIERGRLSPTLGALIRLSDALGISVCELVDTAGRSRPGSVYSPSLEVARAVDLLETASPEAQRFATEVVRALLLLGAPRFPHLTE